LLHDKSQGKVLLEEDAAGGVRAELQLQPFPGRLLACDRVSAQLLLLPPPPPQRSRVRGSRASALQRPRRRTQDTRVRTGRRAAGRHASPRSSSHRGDAACTGRGARPAISARVYAVRIADAARRRSRQPGAAAAHLDDDGGKRITAALLGVQEHARADYKLLELGDLDHAALCRVANAEIEWEKSRASRHPTNHLEKQKLGKNS